MDGPTEKSQIISPVTGFRTAFHTFLLICLFFFLISKIVIERVVDHLPLMTYGLKLSLEA